MPNIGDSFITTLQPAHLAWGDHRHTNSRGIIYGEGYLQIPASIARGLDIYNSNAIGNIPGITNVYNCNSVDNYLVNISIKAAGCSKKGDFHAKQFQGNGNLKALGDWFNHMNAQVGDRVEITWVSPTDMTIELL